jgi:polyhydroxyalkanoate synthesis regulator phasin
MRRTTSNGKRITAIGVTAGVLGGGAIGLMLGVPALTSASGSSPAAVVEQAATPTDDTTTDDTTTDDTTTDDTTTDDTTTDDTIVTEIITDETSDDATTRPEPGVRLREQLQELVDDGTLTSEQADAVATFLVENRPERGFPGGFPGFPGGPGGHGRGHFGVGLESGEIAELFGLERDELRDLLRDGLSLADIATAQGVDVQAVIDTLVNATKEHLDEAVANGRLTQEEADAKLADLTERITEMVNTARPADD